MSPPPSSAGRQSTIEQLTLELSEGLVRSWPSDGQFPVSKLSVMYAVLHKIGI